MKASITRRQLLTGAATLALSGAFAGAAFAADDIVIGAAVAESGWMTAFDGPSLAGFRVFLDEFNANGGLDGRKIVL